MSLLLLDNYDSFTYNLYDYLLQLGFEVTVVRNDAMTLEEFIALNPSALVLSPGPGRPEDAGLLMPLVAHFYDKIPILGICLGYQAIGRFFGADLVKSSVPVHGKTSVITHHGHPLFSGIPENFKVMRYHSLILENLENTDLQPIAQTDDGVLMAISHKRYPLIGLQYHPESVLTEFGMDLLANWRKTIRQKECWTFEERKVYSVIK